MKKPLILFTFCLAMLAYALAPPNALAINVVWDIDESESGLSLAFPDQVISVDGQNITVGFTNQGGPPFAHAPWTVGNGGPIDGTISSNWDIGGGTINFAAANNAMFGVETGSFAPLSDPPGGDGSAPAFFAGEFQANVIVWNAVLNMAARDVVLNFDTLGAVPVAGGLFDPTTNGGITGVESGGLAVRSLGAIGDQILPDGPEVVVIPPLLLPMLGGLGSITSPDPIGQPLLRRLQIDYVAVAAFAFDDASLLGTNTGTIVAYATIPEPSTVVLGLMGSLGLVVLRLRRKRA